MKHSPLDIYPLGGVRLLLASEVEKIGGMRKWARAHRMTAAHVSRVISGHAMPGPKVLKALCLKESTVYVPTRFSVNGRASE